MPGPTCGNETYNHQKFEAGVYLKASLDVKCPPGTSGSAKCEKFSGASWTRIWTEKCPHHHHHLEIKIQEGAALAARIVTHHHCHTASGASRLTERANKLVQDSINSASPETIQIRCIATCHTHPATPHPRQFQQGVYYE